MRVSLIQTEVLWHEGLGSYLNHVFLDTSTLMAAKDGEQLFIRDKEETWKSISFRVKIVIQ